MDKKLEKLVKTDYKKIVKTIKSVHDKEDNSLTGKIPLYAACLRMITNFQNNWAFRLPIGHSVSRRVDELVAYNNER